MNTWVATEKRKSSIHINGELWREMKIMDSKNSLTKKKMWEKLSK